MKKCKKCGAQLILKSTTDINGVFSKYWKCPTCGHEYTETPANRTIDFLLKRLDESFKELGR